MMLINILILLVSFLIIIKLFYLLVAVRTFHFVFKPFGTTFFMEDMLTIWQYLYILSINKTIQTNCTISVFFKYHLNFFGRLFLFLFILIFKLFFLKKFFSFLNRFFYFLLYFIFDSS
jgi:hypothetical protein